ncbi:hypothetical protein D3C85_1028010 [compost metagenome]
MITLGQKGRDKITKFEGIITGRAQYITGCDQYVLVPEVRDGKVDPSQWFDEGRIEIIGVGITAESVTAVKNGGPNRDAPSV